jgi:hemolysin activation/secretion protein
MAAKITVHYRRNGYFVAQAYLPEQDIKNGVVTIAVIEGRYGQVTLNNQAPVSTALAEHLLGGIKAWRSGCLGTARAGPVAALRPAG